MISTLLSRASAAFLLVGGVALLFASDEILTRFIPTFPVDGSWVGQLLGASWLAVAALNWISRSVMLGGIYGRPVVLTNLALYFIGAMVLLKVAVGDAPPVVSYAMLPMALFAVSYGWLLLRGPLERDFNRRGDT